MKQLDAVPCDPVSLTVFDTGVGMYEEARRHVFEPCYTTKRFSFGGGLGPTGVCGTMRPSGGTIEALSATGMGAEWRLYLPVGDEGSEVGSDAPLPARRGGAETILVVEDDEAVRSVVRQILETRGFHVLEASRGEDAISICEEYDGRIHLLLADVVMPEMNGPEVASRVRERRGETKILYMSGYPKGVLNRRAGSTERAPLIMKPFSPDELVDKVRETLDQG